MSESCLVGDAQQLDYSRTAEKVSTQEKSKLYGASVSSATAAGNSIPQAIGTSTAFSALGVSPDGIKPRPSQEEVDEPIYYDEANEGRP